MERAGWLQQMRARAEALYDHLSPLYWVTFGFYENETHLEFLRKFLELIPPGAPILSAACGAGRYDGLLLEAGHPVVGTDQSAGMLARARQHFPLERYPQLRYEKVGLQEIDFQAAFDGATCIDALEHVCPEDWLGILHNLSEALKPGGVLYFTVDEREPGEIAAAYARAKQQGLPVVLGEVVDKVEFTDDQLSPLGQAAADLPDAAVYHYCPPLEQVRAWLAHAGLAVEAEGASSGYRHILARKTTA